MMHIDTVKKFGNGKAEEWVGLAIVGRKREDIF
jgi:aryl-alcohol dehydrogenase-like predicted oxidoreductase